MCIRDSHYAAFYRWLATPQSQGGWGADAIVHMGKHGTLEWLPGKGVGLSGECFPDLLLADMPLIYPFIINDPGEGSQSKRRAHAVIVDHLTPPMTSAQTYGALSELNQLVNEYYAVEKMCIRDRYLMASRSGSTRLIARGRYGRSSITSTRCCRRTDS